MQERLHARFRELLADRGARVVDMLPRFRRHGSLGLYAGHVFVRRHRLIAEAVLPELRALLR